MQRHYAGSLTLQHLADIAGSHPSYYSAQFKRRLGISPINYLNRLTRSSIQLNSGCRIDGDDVLFLQAVA